MKEEFSNLHKYLSSTYSVRVTLTQETDILIGKDTLIIRTLLIMKVDLMEINTRRVGNLRELPSKYAWKISD